MNHFETLQQQWRQSLSTYGATPQMGSKGLYMPIRPKFMTFLNTVWEHWGNNVLDVGALLRAGKEIRVFGDPHFEHQKIILLCDRPFETVELMDEQLWNAVAQAHEEADFVLCMGDWSMNRPLHWQKRVAEFYPGKHSSVIGNHDMQKTSPNDWCEANAYAALAFSIDRERIQGWLEKNESEDADFVDWNLVPEVINVGVSHWPVDPYYYPDASWVNLHGHTHNKPSMPLRMNASMENIGFVPQSIDKMFTVQLLMSVIRRKLELECSAHRASQACSP